MCKAALQDKASVKSQEGKKGGKHKVVSVKGKATEVRRSLLTVSNLYCFMWNMNFSLSKV